jgi:DNA uptake protein ComE-like DNA-binding protein
MASPKAISIRRQTAINQIAQILGVHVDRRSRDAALAEALTLETIAAALIAGAVATAPPDLAVAIQATTQADLETIPGIGSKSAQALITWAKESSV